LAKSVTEIGSSNNTRKHSTPGSHLTFYLSRISALKATCGDDLKQELNLLYVADFHFRPKMTSRFRFLCFRWKLRTKTPKFIILKQAEAVIVD